MCQFSIVFRNKNSEQKVTEKFLPKIIETMLTCNWKVYVVPGSHMEKTNEF